jgi:hypothetical protein
VTPVLVYYDREEEYRGHFYREYCREAVITFDGWVVRFRRAQFDHAFFESQVDKDDTFSRQRAERIDWIKIALQDPDVELRQGWDNKRKRAVPNRRVAIVFGSFVVVVRLKSPPNAEFVTAFVATERTLMQIRTNPRWG